MFHFNCITFKRVIFSVVLMFKSEIRSSIPIVQTNPVLNTSTSSYNASWWQIDEIASRDFQAEQIAKEQYIIPPNYGYLPVKIPNPIILKFN